MSNEMTDLQKEQKAHFETKLILSQVNQQLVAVDAQLIKVLYESFLATLPKPE